MANFCHQLLAGLNKQGSFVFCSPYINKIYRCPGCVLGRIVYCIILVYDASVVCGMLFYMVYGKTKNMSIELIFEDIHKRYHMCGCGAVRLHLTGMKNKSIFFSQLIKLIKEMKIKYFYTFSYYYYYYFFNGVNVLIIIFILHFKSSFVNKNRYCIYPLKSIFEIYLRQQFTLLSQRFFVYLVMSVNEMWH